MGLPSSGLLQPGQIQIWFPHSSRIWGGGGGGGEGNQRGIEKKEIPKRALQGLLHPVQLINWQTKWTDQTTQELFIKAVIVVLTILASHGKKNATKSSMIRPFFYFFFFLPCCMACKTLVPWPGIEPGPWQRKCRVLITRPSGNPQDISNGYCKLSFESHKNKTFDNHFCEPCDLQSPLSKKILKHVGSEWLLMPDTPESSLAQLCVVPSTAFTGLGLINTANVHISPYYLLAKPSSWTGW